MKKLILPDTYLNKKPFQEKVDEAYNALRKVIDKYQYAVIGSIKEQSFHGAQIQWLVIVKILSELCQYGTEEECKEITDALYKTLVEVWFKDQNKKNDDNDKSDN
jgi:hypothetical protein